jgi:chromate transporter
LTCNRGYAYSSGVDSAATNKPNYTLLEITRYFLQLGALGFGGPVALVGFMRRDLVDARGWISEAEYKEGLALSQLAPGPLAAQLAMYLGYVHHGILGSSLVGLAFVLPSFVMVVTLGWAYTRFGGLEWMQAVFYAVSACVIGIIANSAYKLAVKTLARDSLLWVIFVVVMIWTFVTESEAIWLFLAGGTVTLFVKSPPRWFKASNVSSLSGLLLLAGSPVSAQSSGLLSSLFWYFFQAGAFVFGSGLAIVPFLYGGVVKTNHWLTDQQFVDAVAVAMITPGPVVITTAFIGYLVAGFPGASVAAIATFLPAYLLTIIPAPYFKRYGKQPSVAAFVDGVTAAATGAICGAVIVLGRRSLIDVPTVLFALVTLIVLFNFKKIPEPVIVVIAAIFGLIVYPLVKA